MGRRGGLRAARIGTVLLFHAKRGPEGPMEVVSEDRNGVVTQRLPTRFNEIMDAVARKGFQGI